jgi:hypothetical protein
MANLREISAPEAIAFTPQTLGWALLAVLLLLALGCIGWRSWRSWRASAYRREALAQLKWIESADAMHPAERLWSISSLLKRVALVSFSRGQVARLSGEDWLRFLDQSLGGREFRDGPGRMLAAGPYDRQLAIRLERDQLRKICRVAGRGVRRHQVRSSLLMPSQER